MEALITMDCSCHSENITDILFLFKQIGWSVYNSQEKVEFLPAGDNNEYDWRCEEISESELSKIISYKISRNEEIGINLFYKNGVEGITFLAHNTKQIVLSLSINRRVINYRNTDMCWYLENIIYRLLKLNVHIVSYNAEEFED